MIAAGTVPAPAGKLEYGTCRVPFVLPRTHGYERARKLSDSLADLDHRMNSSTTFSPRPPGRAWLAYRLGEIWDLHAKSRPGADSGARCAVANRCSSAGTRRSTPALGRECGPARSGPLRERCDESARRGHWIEDGRPGSPGMV
jgi:hypothetical protein